MAETFTLSVNGETHEVEADSDTPLLYVLMNDLELKGPKFGCGLAQCGACSVMVDGREVRSCVYPVSAVRDAEITTLEGLPHRHAKAGGGNGADPQPHPIQTALIELQAPQCGYCYGGIAVKAAELLDKNPTPSEAEIVAHMDGHLCRCGTYPRIIAAIRLAAQRMAGVA